MKELYEQEIKIMDKNKEEERREILLSIIKTKKELDMNQRNYEFAEGDLIDYYLYQIKANKAKLDYLIKEAKRKKIIVGFLEKINYEEVI